MNNKIIININNINSNNNIYSYENSNSNSRRKKGIDNDNTSKEWNPAIKINNSGVQNAKQKPVNIFSNKSHYIPVSNNKLNNMANPIKANTKGKSIKKSNEVNNMGEKIICHPSRESGSNKPRNNSDVMRKNVKVGSNITNNK